MGFWDKDTHMSKTEWRSACKRTLQEFPTCCAEPPAGLRAKIEFAASLWYIAAMTITLTPGQQKRLEAAVAAGQFASVEEAVRFAVDHMVLADIERDDLSWAKPYLDEARAQIARGETVSLEEVFAETDAWLKKRGA